MTECQTLTCIRQGIGYAAIELRFNSTSAQLRCAECCRGIDSAAYSIAYVLHNLMCPTKNCIDHSDTHLLEYLQTATRMVLTVHDGRTARKVSWEVFYHILKKIELTEFIAVNRTLKVHEALLKYVWSIDTGEGNEG